MAEATADTATDTQPEPADTGRTDAEQPDTGLEAEVEKWKALAKKHEDRAKGNAAKARELEEALVEVGSRLVDAEFRVVTAGRGLDVDALLDGLDRSKFLTDTGEPDGDAVKSWVDRIMPASTEPQAPLSAIDLGQGNASTPALGDDDAFAQILLAKVGGPKTK